MAWATPVPPITAQPFSFSVFPSNVAAAENPGDGQGLVARRHRHLVQHKVSIARPPRTLRRQRRVLHRIQAKSGDPRQLRFDRQPAGVDSAVGIAVRRDDAIAVDRQLDPFF
jgi:hypothetical protein